MKSFCTLSSKRAFLLNLFRTASFAEMTTGKIQAIVLYVFFINCQVIRANEQLDIFIKLYILISNRVYSYARLTSYR
jgi:hypothetical protein